MELTTVNALLEELRQNIGGDWLLLGGTLACLEFGSPRATEDIDLMRVSHERLSEIACRTAVFQAAQRLGLTPEHVNSAADFFVRQVLGWESELVLLSQGKVGRVYRPSLTLYACLKLGRGSEIDLEDLRYAVNSCGSAEFDERKFLSWASPDVKSRFLACRAFVGL